MADHLETVARVKSKLLASGADLSGPCGAFQITKRVAWELRAEGYGLVDKPSGNKCQGYSVDVLMLQNGEWWDILTDSGGTNGPAWNKGDGTIDPSRWRAPMDPGDVQPGPTPPTPSLSAVPPVDLAEVLRRLDVLTWQAAAIVPTVLGAIRSIPVPPAPAFPAYKGKIFGMTITLTPEVQ